MESHPFVCLLLGREGLEILCFFLNVPVVAQLLLKRKHKL